MPKRPALEGVAAEVVRKTVIVLVIEGALLLASFSSPEMLNCLRPALLNLIKIKTRDQSV